ncbi:hypothetical protein HHK36_006188 [Tetracentron sinense]|uniref:Uncharacterized protein n=1 Tax=Tetracentron sinense TaxID=13715 RepID=A0A834ZL34_TETSI|nr:hypothetical protein HHK36_006188 [Tetracentron sinense]
MQCAVVAHGGAAQVRGKSWGSFRMTLGFAGDAHKGREEAQAFVFATGIQTGGFVDDWRGCGGVVFIEGGYGNTPDISIRVDRGSERRRGHPRSVPELAGGRPLAQAGTRYGGEELRDLRSQLHYAADYCEMAFFKAKQKKMVMENTKEYICRAVVTVVDHLGSASANLESRLSQNNEFSETELRINCLKQKLLLCEQYTHKLDLNNVRWDANYPRYHPRYISAIRNPEKSNGVLREADDSVAADIMYKYKLDKKEEVPLFLYTTYAQKPSLAKISTSDTGAKKLGTNSGFELSTLLPIRDSPSTPSKARRPFNFQGTRKLGRGAVDRKPVQRSDFLSLLKRSNRTI